MRGLKERSEREGGGKWEGVETGEWERETKVTDKRADEIRKKGERGKILRKAGDERRKGRKEV